jgi:prepilin-type N-terminal cleavage/methylation domain-containing protein
VRKAFTLMELMLVVVIVGIIYAMALSTFKIPDVKDLDALSLQTLPKYMRETFPLMDAKMVCFEPCGECGFLVNGEWNEDKLELFNTTDVTAYRIDREGYTHEQEYAPHDVNDAYKKACFILHKRSNDSIEATILQVQKDFYYYRAAYEEVKHFDTLNSVEQFYQQRMARIEDEQ